MNATNVLTWISRALFAAGLLLFVGLFIYMFTMQGDAGGDAEGDPASWVYEGQARAFVLTFSSIAWCWLAGAAVRTLARATSWPRALLEIAPNVGFGLVFAAPLAFVSDPSSGVLAAVLAGTGIVVFVVARVAYFVAFGAREAVDLVEQAVAQVKHSIADSRAENYSPPPPLYTGVATPVGTVFTPEPLEPERPSPGA